jgi:hypothetical protein
MSSESSSDASQRDLMALFVSAIPAGLNTFSDVEGFRGRLQVNIDGLPEPPPSIRSVEDPLLRQHGLDAWAAATRLEKGIGFWTLFLYLMSLKFSIDDEAQQAITTIFPQLSSFQLVLDYVEMLGANEASSTTSSSSPQPLLDLIGYFYDIIKQHARALMAIGVNAPSFASGAPTQVWENLGPAFKGPVNLTVIPPVIPLPSPLKPELLKLQREARSLLRLLEVAPATALNAPKFGHVQPAPKPRLNVDRQNLLIVFDDIGYSVTAQGAALVDALLRAEGDWRPTSDLQADPQLLGSRIDRIRDKLPPPIHALIESTPGKGNRLKLDFLSKK